MLKASYFESLAIAGIALGLLLASVLFNPVNALAGVLMVIGCSGWLYRHYAKDGTDADVLDDGRAARP